MANETIDAAFEVISHKVVDPTSPLPHSVPPHPSASIPPTPPPPPEEPPEAPWNRMPEGNDVADNNDGEDNDHDQEGQPLIDPEEEFGPEPWPEPVDGSWLLDETLRIVGTHLSCLKERLTAIVLWIGLSYFQNAFRHSPILGITSPTKGCGKTTHVAHSSNGLYIWLFMCCCIVPGFGYFFRIVPSSSLFG